jgi:hypothetical protein
VPHAARVAETVQVALLRRPLVVRGSLLSEWRSVEAGQCKRKLVVHADNTRPHMMRQMTDYMEQNGMKRTLHPQYSTDLVPSDSYLFGHVKVCLTGNAFEDADELFGTVQGIVDGIEKMMLQAVFLDWIERLEKCITTDGEYVE